MSVQLSYFPGEAKLPSLFFYKQKKHQEIVSNFHNLNSTTSKIVSEGHLCLVHVIWTGHRMSKLVLSLKYLLLLSFLIVAKFYNMGHIQGIIRVP